MTYGEQMNWKCSDDIKAWASKHGFKNLVARMQLNDDSWMSSGEFGRSQVQICEAIRFAKDESEALEIAKQFNEQFEKNYGLF